MEAGWSAAIPAAVTALCTWYVSRKTTVDREKVVNGTAAQTTSDDILKTVTDLKKRVEKIEKATVPVNEVDHRGPT